MPRLALFLAAAVCCNQSHAQTRNHLLRGLSKVDLVIEELSSGAKPCGLTEEAIRAAVMYRLSSTTIALENLADVTLYINVDTLYPDVGCFSVVSIEAHTFQKVTLEFSGDERRVDIILWKSESLLTSNRKDHARQVSDKIENLAKKFITDWNLDNKP